MRISDWSSDVCSSDLIPRRGLLSSALLMALAPAVSAQVAAPDPQDSQEQQSGQTAPAGEVEPDTLATIVVNGIRGSLISSMNIKRDAQGIVDGIVAEDIGTTPETNMAESLPAISGFSMARSE